MKYINSFYRYFVKWPTLAEYDNQVVSDNWEMFGRFANSFNDYLYQKSKGMASQKSIRRWENIENSAISECIPF